MALTLVPKAGMVLVCDFDGYLYPEIIKKRPIVVISPTHLKRPGLVTVVPLSTTLPTPVERYHYKLKGNPVPGSKATEVWAKCDLVATVSVERLDRVEFARRQYRIGNVSPDQVRAMRRAVLWSLGIDLDDPRTYNVDVTR
jgi:uncharacterized protein YifN (PemK superfamily)